MDMKTLYFSPELREIELNQEGVLCSSDRDGSIDNLTPGPDWSDMWND